MEDLIWDMVRLWHWRAASPLPLSLAPESPVIGLPFQKALFSIQARICCLLFLNRLGKKTLDERMPDRGAPIAIRIQCRDPVPFTIAGTEIEPNGVARADEQAGRAGSHGVMQAMEPVGMMIGLYGKTAERIGFHFPA